jgi:hypothetical protein
MIFHKASGRILLSKPAKKASHSQSSMEESANKGAPNEEIKSNFGLKVVEEDVEPDKYSKSKSR